MQLLKASRLIKEPTEISEEVTAMLEAHADMFVRAGGQVTLTEWTELNDFERAAILKAKEKLTHETAFINGMAQHSDMGRSEVYATIDGGEMRALTFLNQALDQAILKTRNG